MEYEQYNINYILNNYFIPVISTLISNYSYDYYLVPEINVLLSHANYIIDDYYISICHNEIWFNNKQIIIKEISYISGFNNFQYYITHNLPHIYIYFFNIVDNSKRYFVSCNLNTLQYALHNILFDKIEYVFDLKYYKDSFYFFGFNKECDIYIEKYDNRLQHACTQKYIKSMARKDNIIIHGSHIGYNGFYYTKEIINNCYRFEILDDKLYFIFYRYNLGYYEISNINDVSYRYQFKSINFDDFNISEYMDNRVEMLLGQKDDKIGLYFYIQPFYAELNKPRYLMELDIKYKTYKNIIKVDYTNEYYAHDYTYYYSHVKFLPNNVVYLTNRYYMHKYNKIII